MRMFFGIILGAVLTVSAAYLYDTMSVGSSAAGTTTARPMVNWEVVAENWRTLKGRAMDGWSKLSKPSAG